MYCMSFYFCMFLQLLPVVTEQLQWMPYVNPKLHVPVIKFIYWSIRHIDTDIQVKQGVLM